MLFQIKFGLAEWRLIVKVSFYYNSHFTYYDLKYSNTILMNPNLRVDTNAKNLKVNPTPKTADTQLVDLP